MKISKNYDNSKLMKNKFKIYIKIFKIMKINCYH